MPEFSDEHWMRAALILAKRADGMNEVPVGAIIVQDNIVIGEGFNRPISSADPTAHAEIVALRNAAQQLDNYRLPNTTLYVTVEPCAMCAGAIIHSRIKRVVYGAAEPKAGAVCSHLQLFDQPQMNHRVDWVGGVLAADATAALQTFFVRRREEKRKAKDI